MGIRLLDKNDIDSESKNSFTNQIESYDAYNILLDRNSKKNEEELNVMKKYDILNDENLIQEDDDKEMREKIKEHFPKLDITYKDIGSDPDKRNYIVSNKRIMDTGFKCEFDLDYGIEELKKMYNLMFKNTGSKQ